MKQLMPQYDEAPGTAILACLCYFDVFRYPLTVQQIRDYLPQMTLEEQNIKKHLHSPPLNTLISCRENYYFLNDRDPSIVDQRLKDEQLAQKRWRTAKIMTKIIKMFPFVRAVFISGNLSKNLSRKESDIDYFILTAPGKLWISRILLTAFKKIVLLNKRTWFCINYFRTTDHLGFQNSADYFTATELITLTPIYNSRYKDRLLLENKWLKSFFPNYRHNGNGISRSSDRHSILQKVLEQFCRIFDTAKWDRFFMKFMEKNWKMRLSVSDGNQIALSKKQDTSLYKPFNTINPVTLPKYRISPNECTALGEDSQRLIMSEFHDRLNSLKRKIKIREMV